MKKIAVYLSLFILFVFAAFGGTPVFGHGGENHGDEKPKTTASGAGTISHTARLGVYEVMFKHPAFEPDAATAARIFVTKFETNEPAEAVVPAIEFEAAGGAVTAATVEKTDRAGSFAVKVPALPAGVYTVRARLTYQGETDTATFSGVEVKTHEAAAAETGAMSWTRSVLIGVVFALVLALFAALVFFVWRFAAGWRLPFSRPSFIRRTFFTTRSTGISIIRSTSTPRSSFSTRSAA